MEPLYVVGLVMFCAVIGEAKLFIGDCSYGFCEQNCKQIKEHEMECYCKRGFALKQDGRKCIKSFVTDDELSSGDDASGEAGNCDNEDGNCDKTTTEVVVISGDGDDDGSGVDVSSIVFEIGVSTSSVKVITAEATVLVPPPDKTVSPADKVVPVPTTTVAEPPVKRLVTTQGVVIPTSSLVEKIHTTTKIPFVKKIKTIHPVVTSMKVPSTKKIEIVQPIITTSKVSSIKTIRVIQPIVPSSRVSSVKTIDGVQPLLPSPKTSTIKTVEAIVPILPTTKVSVIKTIEAIEAISSTRKISTIKTIQAIEAILSTSKLSTIKTIKAIQPIIPSSKVSRIKTIIDSIHPIITDVKATKTISKRPPVLKETVKPSSDKKEIRTSSVQVKDVVSTSKHVIGLRGSPTAPFQPPSQSAVSSVVRISPHQSSRQAVLRTKSVKDTPVISTFVLKKSPPTSISKSTPIPDVKGVVSSATSARLPDKSTLVPEKRRKSPSEKLVSTIYVGPPIEFPVVSSTMTVKQPYVRVAANISVSVPATSSTAGVIQIKKFVIHDGEVDTESLPLHPAPFNKSEYATPKVFVDRIPPGVTMATHSVLKTVHGSGKGSVGVDHMAGPSRKTVATKDVTEKHVATKVVLLESSVAEKLSKHDTIAKIPVYKSKIYPLDKSVVSKTTIKDIGILPIQTIKTSVSSITTTSSFRAVSSSLEDTKKTTPLGVARTPTVVTSRLIDLPVRKSAVEESIATTVLHKKTFVSPSRSLSKVDAEKRTEELSESTKTSIRPLKKVLPTASSRTRETEQSDKVSITSSSPTTRVTETIPRVVVIQESGTVESHGRTLLVNIHLLTVGACVTIYFLSFYQK